MRNEWLPKYSALIFVQWATLLRLVWVRASIETITRVHSTYLRCWYYQDTCVWKARSSVNQYSCYNYTRMTNEHFKHLWERVTENIRQKIKKTPSQWTPPKVHIYQLLRNGKSVVHMQICSCKVTQLTQGGHQITSDYPGFLSLPATIWENLHMTKTSNDETKMRLFFTIRSRYR